MRSVFNVGDQSVINCLTNKKITGYSLWVTLNAEGDFWTIYCDKKIESSCDTLICVLGISLKKLTVVIRLHRKRKSHLVKSVTVK